MPNREMLVKINRPKIPARKFVIVPQVVKPTVASPKPVAEKEGRKQRSDKGIPRKDPQDIEFDVDDYVRTANEKKKNMVVPYDPSPKAVLPKTEKQIKREQQQAEDDTAWGRASSLFGERAGEIMSLVEANDRDGMVTALYRELMKMLVDILPIVEKGVRGTKGFRGVKSLNELVSQIREMIADMQAVQDKGMLGQTLISRYVRPAFLDIAMQMMEHDQRIINEVLPFMPESKRDEIRNDIKRMQKELAKYIQAQYEAIAQNIVKGLT